MRRFQWAVVTVGAIAALIVALMLPIEAQQTGRSTPRTSVVVASGRTVGATAAVASVTSYAVSASGDITLQVWSNVNITTLGSANFTATVAYTDESNSARTLTLDFINTAGTVSTALSTAAGPFSCLSLTIRAKAGTSVTVATTGTFTGATYNVEAQLLLLQ